MLCSFRPGEDLGEEAARVGSSPGEDVERRGGQVCSVGLQGIPFFSITKYNKGVNEKCDGKRSLGHVESGSCPVMRSRERGRHYLFTNSVRSMFEKDHSSLWAKIHGAGCYRLPCNEKMVTCRLRWE